MVSECFQTTRTGAFLRGADLPNLIYSGAKSAPPIYMSKETTFPLI